MPDLSELGSRIPLESLEATALHEAAHVICALAVGLDVGQVTITADEERLGFFTRQQSLVRFDVHDVSAVYAAGLVAEELWCIAEFDRHGAADDLAWIEKLGTGPEFLAEARRRALEMCSRLEQPIRVLAARLMNERTLAGSECKAIYREAQPQAT
jgi:hypothetical protein